MAEIKRRLLKAISLKAPKIVIYVVINWRSGKEALNWRGNVVIDRRWAASRYMWAAGYIRVERQTIVRMALARRRKHRNIAAWPARRHDNREVAHW